MLPETLERIYSLLEQGATVVADAPQSIATLKGGNEAQERFDKAVDNIWGNANNGGVSNIGKGRLLSGVTIDKALQMLYVKADVKGDVRWLHRKVKGADWYFVTPKKSSSFGGKVEFRAEGAVELWNPVTGEISPINAERNGEYASVELNMAKGGSCFVVFKQGKKQQKAEERRYATEQSIDGEWTVTFPAGWGATEELKLSELVAWRDMPHSAEGKAFSGSAVYSTTFELQSPSKQLLLDLGEVDMIAEVTINGKSLRPLWCQPYQLDITDYVRKGENTLQVKVTSTWFNRLVYDASRPEAERKTWTISGPSANSPLRATGLLGPVVLRY